MKRYLFMAASVLCGVLAAALVVGFLRYRDQAAKVDELEGRRAEVCTRLKSKLEAIVAKQITDELRGHVRLHQLDQGLTRLCLGVDVPDVGGSEADECWIMSKREDCYRDVAKKLLELYRATGHEKRLRQQ